MERDEAIRGRRRLRERALEIRDIGANAIDCPSPVLAVFLCGTSDSGIQQHAITTAEQAVKILRAQAKRGP
jgi:hypothetical protein